MDSLVYAFREGDSPEAIQQEYPSLTLEQVYGVIAFYLGHQAEVDANILEGEAQVRAAEQPLQQRRPEAYQRLKRAREHVIDRS